MFHCETTVAKTGKEAVDLFLEGKKFDIVLCEKEMPAVEKIRAIGETDVKIVGVSVDCNAMEAFMSAGADVFVPKPITLDVLSPIIQEIINKKNNAMV
ncbi:two-component response regulator ORR42-like [Lolium perenne]|uniref:two-component response regulator ORR42-like n=1 Tax=Lolium perenne TaxID=4522 RepID=UPI003A99A138